jgi:hypothetical protein
MNAATLHSTPSLRTIVEEQIRTVGLSIRDIGLVVLTLYLVVIGVTIAQLTRFQSPTSGRPSMTNFTFTPESSMVVMFLALIVPLRVWQDEEPAKRSYHWVMPLPRHVHSLLKVLAGWVWTMVGVALFLAGTVILAFVAARISGIPQPYHRNFSAWEWLVPFTAASIAYALASCAAVGGRRPFMWVFVAIAAYYFVIFLLLKLGMTEAVNAFRLLWNGRYGASAAMTGANIGSNQMQLGPYAELPHWLGVTALWGCISGGLLFLVARRHTEPR